MATTDDILATDNGITSISKDDLVAIRTEDGDETVDVRRLFPVESKEFPAILRPGLLERGITDDDVVRLSEAFVRERRAALGKLQPQFPRQSSMRLLFEPIAAVVPRSILLPSAHVMLVTAGLIELLRVHAISSVWSNRLDQVEKQLGKPLMGARAARAYLNLRAVLFLIGKMPLPRLEEHVGIDIRDNGYRVAEVALLFILLHESGHGAYTVISDEERRSFRQGVEASLAVTLSPSQAEELYADQYAVTCVPADAIQPIIHSSLVFFTLQGFVEAVGWKETDTHPRPEVRLQCLLDFARTHCGLSEEKMRAPAKQLESMQQLSYDQKSVQRTPQPALLEHLVKLATVGDKLGEWKSAVESVCAIENAL